MVSGVGDLLISAGTDTNFNRDIYKMDARTDVLAGSLIPINVIDSQAVLVQQNRIVIGQNAHLQTAGDIKLHAEQDGFADMVSKAKAVTWMSAIEDSAVGDSPLGQQAQEQYSGTINVLAVGSVTNDGILTTGIRRQRQVTIGALDAQGRPLDGIHRDLTRQFSVRPRKEFQSFRVLRISHRD